MFREETEKEKVDDRAANAGDRMINNHRKGTSYTYLTMKRSDNDNRMQIKKEHLTGININNETQDQEKTIGEDRSKLGNLEVRKVNTINYGERKGKMNQQQIVECAICHIKVDNTNFGEDIADCAQSRCCSEGRLLCQRCAKKFSVQSGINRFQFRKPCASLSHDRDNNLSRIRTRRNYNLPVSMSLRSSVHTLESCRDQCAHNFNRTKTETNKTINYDENMSGAVSYVNRDRGDVREERIRDCGMRYQWHSYCNFTSNSKVDRYTSKGKIQDSTPFDYSRRPIRCPRLDCSVNVTFFALAQHFLFDHPDVPIVNVEPGVQSTLIVGYDSLTCSSSRCLVSLTSIWKAPINPKYGNRLPLSVLAARLHTDRNAHCEEMQANEVGHCEKSEIIVWVAGLDVATDRLRCSIQAVDNIDNGGFRSLTYTGPITSLRIDQRPQDVFLAGDCVVLHEELINRITTQYTSLNINIIVH